MRFGVEQKLVACSLSAVGLGYGALLLLSGSNARLTRWVDRHLLPYGVSR